MSSQSNSYEMMLVNESRTEDMDVEDKVEFILKNVRKGKVIILEEGLQPTEQSELIEVTMNEIDPGEFNDFTGIELEADYERQNESGIRNRVSSLVRGGQKQPKMAVVGPDDMLETEKLDDSISALISR